MAVAPGAHAVLVLDQAGWHLSDKLFVPPNITLVPLPPKCPELNPVENVWQFIRDNWLSNRVFRSYADILEHSNTAALRGTSSSTSLGPSCQSDCAIGRSGSDQWDLVLAPKGRHRSLLVLVPRSDSIVNCLLFSLVISLGTC
jgi:hypothetical protein